MPAMARRTAWCLLALGAALTILTGPRWGIAALAWLAPVPYLLFARGVRGWRPWLALLGALVAAHSMQVVLIATSPVPMVAMLLVGPPLALLRFGAIAAGEIIRRRSGEAAGALAYVAATVLLDWVGYDLGELGAWMATASGQVESLTFLQLASIAGLAGLGAIMATVAVTVASLLAAPHPTRRLGPALAVAGGLVALMLWATFRLDQPLPGTSMTVAAVVTDVGPEDRPPVAVAAIALAGLVVLSLRRRRRRRTVAALLRM